MACLENVAPIRHINIYDGVLRRPATLAIRRPRPTQLLGQPRFAHPSSNDLDSSHDGAIHYRSYVVAALPFELANLILFAPIRAHDGLQGLCRTIGLQGLGIFELP